MKAVTKINYVKGDATCPVSVDGETRVILHVCNDIGKWGKGFVMALSKKWPVTKQVYHQSSKELGSISLCKVDDANGVIIVCNMIAQHGIYTVNNIPPIRYDSLRACLNNIANWARAQNQRVSFHGPRFGAGLAGGKWIEIEALLIEILSDHPIYIYDL